METKDQDLDSRAPTADLMAQAVRHTKANRLEKARELYLKILEKEPKNARAIQYLGVISRRQGRPKRAIELMEHSLKLDAEDVGCYNNLSRAYLDAGQFKKAVTTLQEGLKKSPQNARLMAQLATAYIQKKDYEEAIEVGYRALEIEPENLDVYLSIGSAMQMLGRTEDAERLYEHVLAKDPNNAKVHQNKGALLKNLGRVEEAESAYRRALNIAPDMAGAWRAVAELKKYKSGDPDIDKMEKIYARPDLERSSRENICFALGKVFDDLGESDKAFTFYAEGNDTRYKNQNFDLSKTLRDMRRVRNVADTNLVERLRGLGDPDPTPIFILGMPRSGTTLVEQILASHPCVTGGGELYDLSRVLTRAGEITETPTGMPDWLTEVGEREIKALGRAYIDSVREKWDDDNFITDKMPANFRFVGLIHLMLPNARIIHIRRHPADTCLSCYTKLFTEGQEFSFNLQALGRFYRAYEETMAHWRAVLPPGTMLEVEYERVVADVESQTRRLLDYCGLEWDDACLRFFENDREVRTASQMQVRRPIYKSSVQRWRRYEKHLKPFFNALAEGYWESGPE